MNFAPVVLFVYNRPDHTRRTVEALKKNLLSSQSDLYIFSDAPKKIEAAEAVREVRKYLKSINGFRSVHIVERDKNWGLANSIIDGVTRLCNEYGRVIVLEDDLITSPFFLNYMNDALDVYQDEEKVMHVSGYMFPVESPEKLPTTFFYRASTCWGWGTWKRSWDNFEVNADLLLENIRSRNQEREFDVNNTMKFMAMLKSQSMGALDSWAILWYAKVFLKNGLCLHPAISLVDNIGLDGSGIHCDSSEVYASDLLNARLTRVDKLQEITESPEGLAAIEKFNRTLMLPFIVRVYFGLIRRLKIFLAWIHNKESK